MALRHGGVLLSEPPARGRVFCAARAGDAFLPPCQGETFFALRGRRPISREKWGKELRNDGGWAAVRFLGGQRVGSRMVAR